LQIKLSKTGCSSYEALQLVNELTHNFLISGFPDNLAKQFGRLSFGKSK